MLLESIANWWQTNERLTYLLVDALGETLLMVFSSGLIGFAIGIPAGVALHLTKDNGLLENKALNKILGTVTNIGRSIPFIILLVAIIPFTRFVVGSSIGTAAAIVPLTVGGAIPFIARLVEGGPCWKYQQAWLKPLRLWEPPPTPDHQQGAASRGTAGGDHQCGHYYFSNTG